MNLGMALVHKEKSPRRMIVATIVTEMIGASESAPPLLSLIALNGGNGVSCQRQTHDVHLWQHGHYRRENRLREPVPMANEASISPDGPTNRA
jgi:hypothetical protein